MDLIKEISSTFSKKNYRNFIKFTRKTIARERCTSFEQLIIIINLQVQKNTI